MDEGMEEERSRWEKIFDALVIYATGPAIEATIVLIVLHFWPDGVKVLLALILFVAGVRVHLMTDVLNNVKERLEELNSRYGVATQAIVEARARAGEAEYLLAKKEAEGRGEKVPFE